MTTSKRNNLIDVLKGLLIILVVVGHTNTVFTKWIYSFHMAAFFAISGFLWNDKYIATKEKRIKFIKSRIKRLYLPFVLVNVIFILLNNLLVRINFYTTNPIFAQLTTGWPVNQVSELYDTKRMITACLKSLILMSGSAPLVSTCWFLSTLLIITVGHFSIQLLLKNRSSKIHEIVYASLLIACLTVAYLKSIRLISIPGGGSKGFSGICSFFDRKYI